jgi:hypothetical protein
LYDDRFRKQVPHLVGQGRVVGGRADGNQAELVTDGRCELSELVEGAVESAQRPAAGETDGLDMGRPPGAEIDENDALAFTFFAEVELDGGPRVAAGDTWAGQRLWLVNVPERRVGDRREMVCAGRVVLGGVALRPGEDGAADVQVRGEHRDLAALVEVVQQPGSDCLLHPADAVVVGTAPALRILEGVHTPVSVHERQHAEAQDRPVCGREPENAAVGVQARLGNEVDVAVRAEELGEHLEQPG